MTVSQHLKAILLNSGPIVPGKQWRNVPSRSHYGEHFYPGQFSSAERATLAAFAAATSGVDRDLHEDHEKDQWHQYAVAAAPDSVEALDMCFSAINIPSSRYSAGTHPVWYGASSEDSSQRETAYHIKRQLLHELAGLPNKDHTGIQRCMYLAEVGLAAGVDLRPFIDHEPRLLEDGPPYPFCNEVGASAVALSVDGLITRSKRGIGAFCVVVFDKASVKQSRARYHYAVTVYRDGRVYIMDDLVEI